MQANLMNCEVCKAIERLGLDASAHDWWFCADGRVMTRQSISEKGERPHHNRRRAAVRVIRQQFRRALNAMAGSLPAHRQHYVTLCLR